MSVSAFKTISVSIDCSYVNAQTGAFFNAALNCPVLYSFENLPEHCRSVHDNALFTMQPQVEWCFYAYTAIPLCSSMIYTIITTKRPLRLLIYTNIVPYYPEIAICLNIALPGQEEQSGRNVHNNAVTCLEQMCICNLIIWNSVQLISTGNAISLKMSQQTQKGYYIYTILHK